MIWIAGSGFAGTSVFFAGTSNPFCYNLFLLFATIESMGVTLLLFLLEPAFIFAGTSNFLATINHPSSPAEIDFAGTDNVFCWNLIMFLLQPNIEDLLLFNIFFATAWCCDFCCKWRQKSYNRAQIRYNPTTECGRRRHAAIFGKDGPLFLVHATGNKGSFYGRWDFLLQPWGGSWNCCCSGSSMTSSGELVRLSALGQGWGGGS